MNILGISSAFHDSSAAVVKDGRVVAAAAEERFSYQKHDSSFPGLSIDECLAQAGLSSADIDWVAYHEDPIVKFSRVLTSQARLFPRGFLSFARTMREFALGQLWIKMDIFKKLGINPKRVEYVPHHFGHAAYSFLASGFESAAVLVADAVGEWACTSLMRANRNGGRLRLEVLETIEYPHSLGLLYSAFTGFLGFRINDGECSLMALSHFGEPKYLDKVFRLLKIQVDGSYELDADFFDFTSPDRLPLSRKFYALFGEPRKAAEPLPFFCTPSEGHAGPSEKAVYYADVAASVQAALEYAVLALAGKIKRETGEEFLCLAGGVALNSTMNGKLMRAAGFTDVFIPPDPGDGGGAIGAALYLAAQNQPVMEAIGPFLGIPYDENEAVSLMGQLDLRAISEHRFYKSDFGPVRTISVQRFEPHEQDRLLQQTARDLRDGKIVGWLQDRFECGPRALGNRSILIDPTKADVAKRLSGNVKLRASFRPYAVSIREEKYSSFFGGEKIPSCVRWMSSTQPVEPSARGWISQALHIDGTTRPQVLSRQENSRYYDLLQTWETESGIPALLNTSFNESGFPMVSSPVDALLMFLRTDMESLVLNNTLIRKKF